MNILLSNNLWSLYCVSIQWLFCIPAPYKLPYLDSTATNSKCANLHFRSPITSYTVSADLLSFILKAGRQKNSTRNSEKCRQWLECVIVDWINWENFLFPFTFPSSLVYLSVVSPLSTPVPNFNTHLDSLESISHFPNIEPPTFRAFNSYLFFKMACVACTQTMSMKNCIDFLGPLSTLNTGLS